LAGILFLAASSGGIPRAALYLFFYSAGLGLPFLLAAFFFNTFIKVSKKLRSRMPIIQRVSGAVLIVIGIFIITGHYKSLSVMAARWQSKLTGKKLPVAESTFSPDSGFIEQFEPQEGKDGVIIDNNDLK
jgi:cytochrome c-type biogenesis protein